MKKPVIFFLMAMALKVHAQPVDLAQPPKSISLQYFVNGAWKTYGKDSYTIDASSHAVRFLSEYADTDSILKPITQCSYTYNSSGLEVQSFSEWWSKMNNIWMPGSVSQNTYNANNRITTTTVKDFNGSVLMQRTYTYDGAGYLISVNNPPWSPGNGKVYGTVSYTNNSAGLPVSELYEDDPSSFPKGLQTYTYYPSGKISEMVEAIITSIGVLNAARIIRIYDPSGKLFEEGYHGWTGTSWLKNETFTYTYLPSGKIDYVMHNEGFGPGAEAPERYQYEWFENYPTTTIAEHANAEDLLQPAVYFDLMGRKTEIQKNVILVEQRGNERRKIFIRE